MYRRQPEAKFRNDENVLGGITAEYRQITTGEEGCGEFVTDLGLVSVFSKMKCGLVVLRCTMNNLCCRLYHVSVWR